MQRLGSSQYQYIVFFRLLPGRVAESGRRTFYDWNYSWGPEGDGESEPHIALRATAGTSIGHLRNPRARRTIGDNGGMK